MTSFSIYFRGVREGEVKKRNVNEKKGGRENERRGRSDRNEKPA